MEHRNEANNRIFNFQSLRTNIYIKLFFITILITLLLIPTHMVKDLIYEREAVQNSAIREVSQKWGNGQTISGPYISIPYDHLVERFNKKDSTTAVVKLKKWIHFMPENLEINGEIIPEKRYRGIYEVAVYESDLNIKGNFDPLNLKQFDIEKENVHFEKATLNIGISDLRGIERQVNLNWNGDTTLFTSGTSTTQVESEGIHAKAPMSNQDSLSYPFDFQLKLKGSGHLYFTPIGKTTDIKLTSNWETPSFTGSFLPDERTIDQNGFTAHWNILHLNRNFPTAWIGDTYQLSGSRFGTNLLLPVDNYIKSHRVARYAVLFIVLTFLIFFFVEVFKKVFIHPIQYLLIGIALVVFYTLLISFSEHVKFNYAYLIATTLTLLLISGYTTAIVKSRIIGGFMLSVLVVLYTFIFIIIQQEDYALVLGSVGVFTILVLVMYFTRKTDWYNIRLGKE